MPFHIPASRFTTAGLSALPTTGKSYDLSDPAVLGLLLRVGPSGSKRWLFRFKWNKRTSRIKIGSFPDIGIVRARECAVAHRKELEAGIDPRRSVRPGAQRPIVTRHTVRAGESEAPTSNFVAINAHVSVPPTDDPQSIEKPDANDKRSVRFLVYEFVEHYVKPNREVPEEVIRILRKDVIPHWKDRDARTITSREIVERLDEIVDRGAPVMANRTAAIFSQMFAFGVHRSILITNPVSLLFMPGGKEYSGDRVLSETELHSFVHGVPAVCTTPVRFHTLMVLFLTLIRRGSLAKATWSEFRFEKKEWRVPAEHDKERRAHVVPLTDWAIEHLFSLQALSEGSIYVLPKRRKNKGERPPVHS